MEQAVTENLPNKIDKPVLTKIERFNTSAMMLVEQLNNLINSSLADGGDTEDTSQKLCLLNRLGNFEYAITGTTQADMQDNK